MFLPAEVWAARDTPAHKPVNVDHKSADVVGHMVASKVIGDTPEGAAFPPSFSVATTAYVYKYWPQDDAKQAAVDALVADLLEPGERPWKVSMECRFRGFDYALLAAGADPFDPAAVTVVARTDQTKFLTKHLRRFGGSGTYAGKRIGRALRNVTFTAVGFTRTPANSKSVVLKVTAAQDPTPAIPPPGPAAEAPVYGTSNERPAPEPPRMTPEETKAKLAAVEADLAAAKAELEAGKAKAAETLKADLAAAAAAHAAKAAELDTTKAALAAAEAAALAAKAEADAAKAELARAADEKKTAERVHLVKDAYQCDTLDQAKAAAEPLKALPDDAFAAHLEAMKTLRPKAEKPAPAAASLAQTEPVKADPAPAVQANPADDKTAALASELATFFGAPEEAPKTKPAKKKN